MLYAQLTVLALLMCNTYYTEGSPTVVNGVFDPIVVNLKKQLGKTEKMPDVDITIKNGSTQGNVKASGGTFSDLSTMKRVGDATFELKGPQGILKATVTFTTCKLDFTKASVHLGAVNAADKLTVTVKKNAVAIEVSATLVGCKATLNSVKLTQFDGLSFDLKGLGAAANVLADNFAKQYNPKIKQAVEAKLKTVLEAEIKKTNVCSLLKG